MKRMHRIVLWSLASLTLFAVAAIRADDKVAAAQPTLDKPALEKRFGDQMSGATLVGTFTVDGMKKPPVEERYTIAKVSKIAGDKWLFMARVQYMKHDVTVPMSLDVLWAGDTPIITLTDLNIPGLGTFTSRVMIYGDRYAGTWQHGSVGGHLWGKIEKAKPTDAKPADAKPTDTKPAETKSTDGKKKSRRLKDDN